MPLSPALLWVLVPLVVEVQGDLGVQPDPKVVVHHTLLGVTVPERGGEDINTPWPTSAQRQNLEEVREENAFYWKR